jgi:micrococcal nuclease
MKRFCLFVFVFFVLCFCAASPPVDTETVYITATGTKYHKEGCSSLRRSKTAVSLADAAASGYGPCSICKPPVSFAVPRPEDGKNGLYQVNREEPSRSSAVDFARLLPAEITGCVDGDTVRVRIPSPPSALKTIETIRLIGVDTPETVHPRREVEAFGKEAGEFTKERLSGKSVRLAFDWELRDRYGRLLAYVYTEDAVCHNAELIRLGYGHAYTRFSFRFLEEFRDYERDARENKRGLWQ